MKKTMSLKHQLSGAQMPPDVGVSHATRRHGEKSHGKHGYENPPG